MPGVNAGPIPLSPRHATHPLDAISNGVSGGPLLLLKGAMASGAPLLVVTRHAHGVRGRCTGEMVGERVVRAAWPVVKGMDCPHLDAVLSILGSGGGGRHQPTACRHCC